MGALHSLDECEVAVLSWTLLIVFATVAVGVSFLCSILEAVLMSTTTAHIQVLQSDGKRFGPVWEQFKDEPERPLTAILTLNTIAHTVGALGVGAQVAALYAGDAREQMAIFVASAVLTVAVLLLSEILPKTLGTIYWKKLSTFTALTLQVLIALLIWIVWPIEKLRGIFPIPVQEKVTRKELEAMVEVAEDENVIEEDEETMITNLLRLKDMYVRDIMTPRVVMTCVSIDKTVSDIMEEIPIMLHGRMPVYGESKDDVRGMVLRSDILRRAAADEDDVTMEELIRPLWFCPADQSVDEALDVLLERKEQMMVVKDEFGGTTGLVTIEDIFETLLGVEIIDESDQEGIEEGVLHEDMRELAKQRSGELNGNGGTHSEE